MQVRKIKLDRIASSTRNASLSQDVLVGDEIVCEEGRLLAVRILNSKFTYNRIEDVNGRMIKLHKDDVLAGVLGYRMALKGYAGVVPDTLAAGDSVQVLNLGGVLGRCTAINPELGEPFEAEVLGSILKFPRIGDRVGQPARIESNGVEPSNTLDPTPPIVFVAGTSMNSGKTVAATEIVRALSHQGMQVAACKLTGVSLMRDVLAMKDAGASRILDFTDAGVVSTRGARILPVSKGLINFLAAEKPDLIVAELGDGLLGDYGVSDILSDAEFQRAASCHIVCAPDPVAAYGAQEIYTQRFGLPIHAMAGPVTDNEVGRGYIETRLKLAAHNARYDLEGLAKTVLDAISNSEKHA